MTDLGSQTCGSRAARVMLLALGAAYLIMLPAQAASAQLPPVPDCVTNPASCLPDPPTLPLSDVDECIKNPASCLPSLPPVDGCVQNPASCLPPIPNVDECVQDPTSCVPLPPAVDKCIENPVACVSDPPEIDRCAEDVSRCLQQDEPDGGNDEDDGGSAAPGERNEPPPSDATGRTGEPAGAPSGGDTSLTSSDTTANEASEAPPIANAGTAIEQLGEGLADAAQRFAFPLAVAALVGAFLLVQARIDRQDPKLAVAPIDSRDDVVSFR